MGVESYSLDAGTDQPYFPEGMSYKLVNDRARQVMSDIRSWYNDSIWIEYGRGTLAPSVLYLNSTQFRIAGADATAFWLVGKAVRASGTITGIIYGIISASVYQGGNTDVTVSWASGSLAAEAIRVWGSAIHPRSVPAGTITSSVIDSTAFATLEEAQQAISTTKIMSPQRVQGFLTSKFATDVEAVDGTTATKVMSPRAVDLYWAAKAATDLEVTTGTDTTKRITPAQAKLAVETFRPVYTSSELSVPANGSAISPVSHGLGDTPRWMECWLVCKTTDRNWAVGDRLRAGDTLAVGGTGRGLVPFATSTTLGCLNAGDASVMDKSTGTPGTITTASWRLVFEAGR
jgi:hypothetical protein